MTEFDFTLKICHTIKTTTGRIDLRKSRTFVIDTTEIQTEDTIVAMVISSFCNANSNESHDADETKV